MQVAAQLTPSDPATVAGALVWAYEQVTGHAPVSTSSYLMPLAQSAFETANWQQMYNNNAGYISQPNTSAPYYYRGSNPVPFAWYPTLGAGCVALMQWLRRHGSLVAADNNDLSGYMAGLQAGGYLGSGGDYAAYQTGIASEIQRYADVVPKPYGNGGLVSNLTTTQGVALGVGVVAAAALAAYMLSPEIWKTRRSWPRPSSAMENPRRGASRRSRGRNSDVQSLMFSRKAGWTTARAQAWAKSHGYRSGSPDVTDAQIHIRQGSPGRFKRIATKSFGRGIQARIGFRR